MSEQREHILACACELYLESGLDGFSMRKLAKQVGVTAPALYRHYDGREAVLTDVLRGAFAEFTRYIYRALGAPTPLERFFGAGDGYLDFVLEHPRWYSIIHTAPEALGIDAMPDDIEATGCAIHQFWNDRVRECMEAGILKPGDPGVTSITMWAHAHGLVQLYHQGQLRMGPDEFRKLFEVSSRRLMAGVATDEWVGEFAARYAAQMAPIVTAKNEARNQVSSP
jgi:AcrR family transcriptional regulator